MNSDLKISPIGADYPAMGVPEAASAVTAAASESGIEAARAAAAGLDQIRRGGSEIQSAELSVIVPVYRELENGNFFRMIRDFTAQTKKDFELVLVINNGLGKPETLLEYERTLQLAQFLEGKGELPSFVATLPSWQKEIIQNAKSKNLRIKTIAWGAERKGNIGDLRQAGFNAVLWAARKEAGADPVVALMDADTAVPVLYVEKILKHFDDPELEALFLNRTLEVSYEGASALFYQTAFWERHAHDWNRNFMVSLFF